MATLGSNVVQQPIAERGRSRLAAWRPARGARSEGAPSKAPHRKPGRATCQREIKPRNTIWRPLTLDDLKTAAEVRKITDRPQGGKGACTNRPEQKPALWRSR